MELSNGSVKELLGWTPEWLKTLLLGTKATYIRLVLESPQWRREFLVTPETDHQTFHEWVAVTLLLAGNREVVPYSWEWKDGGRVLFIEANVK